MALAGILPPNTVVGLQQRQAEEQAANPLVGPQAQQALVPPQQGQQSQDPAAVAANQSQWAKVLERLQDPNIQQAMLTFGAAALQPRGFGQTGASTLANAALAGGTRFTELEQRDVETERKAGVAATAADRNTIAREGQAETKRAAKVAEDRTAEREGPTGIQTRLDEATINQRNAAAERETGASQGATQQLARGLADAFIATGQNVDPDQAFIDALGFVQASGNKNPEQMRLEAKLAWLETVTDPDDEEQKSVFQRIDTAVDAFKKSKEQGRGAPGPAVQTNTGQQVLFTIEGFPGVTPDKAAMLRANEDRAAEFDKAFGPGAAARILKSGGQIQR